jgi:hypothetical protein
MENFEKLGVFYLGQEYDLASAERQEKLVLYDSRDLTTHAVCVGMTGSGKTGLCLGLIEEAAIDNIPAIVIDPKGDLSNLLLTFPQLRAEDFAPWVNAEDAARKGVTSEQFAEQQAELWKKGLVDWGQDGARIRRLQESAEFAIYTPASKAGLPVSILKSFAAPPKAVLDDDEFLRERVSSTATSLLALLGIEGDPMRSREHILLATIFDRAWRDEQDLDLAAVIEQIQHPPVTKMGAIDLETFFPAKNRFALAMQLNTLLASPDFASWLEGEALDTGALLHSKSGKPRVAIFSISHLNDADRMFFVTLLLNQTLSWMRAQSGTSALRAILYMDEIFGYFPPISNPPSKQPLLTLLKQARAFGVGVVLATQNPVDLDYKGLSNAGTWFVGRLQTERDKARLLDGLETVTGAANTKFDRAAINAALSSLKSRVFLMSNVHEDHSTIFQTRWTLSYLRGPLTREQISELMEPLKSGRAEPISKTAAPTMPASKTSSSNCRPLLPPEVPQYFVPVRQTKGVYQPKLLGVAEIHYVDAKRKVDETQSVGFTTDFKSAAVPVEWSDAEVVDLDADELECEPQPDVGFAELPGPAAMPKNYPAWQKGLTNWLFQTQKLELLSSPATGLISNAGESERDFRLRLRQSGREDRDEDVAAIRSKYATKLQILQNRLLRAEQNAERQAAQAAGAKWNTVISVGSTVLGALLGRKAVSAATMGKAATAARAATRMTRESQDVDRAQETVQSVQSEIDALNQQIQDETRALQQRSDPATEVLAHVELRPKKTNIRTVLVCLAWFPE